MTIRYKSATFDLTTTDKTTILTCPSDATCLVKNVQASHATASNVDVDLFLQKSGGSDVEISHKELNKSFLETKIGIMSMIGMFLIHIGILKNLDTFFNYLKINVW